MERSPLPRLSSRIAVATLAVLSWACVAALAQRLPHETGVTWDFETGDLRGWEVEGSAFGGQPTAVDDPWLPPDLAGQQGRFVVTSYGRVQGREAAAIGRLISAPFIVPPGQLSFLVAGTQSSNVRVQFQVYDSIEQQWVTRLVQNGSGSDRLQRTAWNIEQFAGSRARVAVSDDDRAGYITVDDFRFTVAVRNVIGEQARAAREILGKQGFGMRELEAVPSDAATGTVIEQTPKAGTQLVLGGQVDIVVAAPRAQEAVVEVPPFIGLRVRDAMAQGHEARLRVEVRERVPSPRPENEVVDQDPRPGTLVPVGSVVGVAIAAPSILVPDLVGLPWAAARAQRPEGLLLVVGERRASDEPPETVIGQSPRAGERVLPGTRLVITLAAPRGRVAPPRTKTPPPPPPPPPSPLWPWLIATGLVGGGALALGVRALRRRREQRARDDKRTAVPTVRPRIDPGQPVVHAGGPEAPHVSVRLVRDAGSPVVSIGDGAGPAKEQP